MEKVLSSHVGVKINEWYKMIRQFSVPDAEILKAEVEKEIEWMEEDQDLLIYYQLMCFRHQLMLDYIKPSEQRSLSIADLVDKIENSNHKLSGMLHYYNAFFHGMYEFSIKEYVQAIQYYKIAERQLALVVDDIEQAEFHFKVAEAYYIMKQTHVSMHHIIKALDIYKEHEQYKVRQIQSLIVIAGNYDDFKRYEKSLQHLKTAYSIAVGANDQRLVAKTLLNIGNTYDRQSKYTEAIKHYREVLDLISSEKNDIKPITLFSLCWSLYKSNQTDEADLLVEDGLMYSLKVNDSLSVLLFKALKAIYMDTDEQAFKEVLDIFEEKKLHVYVEAFAQSIGLFYEKKGDFEKAAEYYRKALKAQNDIQKGECLYDY
ncbi:MULTISPECIES: Rap family tetratricopeptide repeat protein [Bacillus]|jgi:response regulator aspartate phosphatase H|uniref:Rap family tetratricopeptide repeat protein n=1 Tax=Bacillus TaxID=1386 RepID=UPI00081FC6BE|nr:Rap family tetratricopeptide repeat protein [Bacillus pumilus]AOC57128.1 aspartate phosphatase [Bacillus pumilus]MBR0588693.1 tetratricopeptide repeat protein [Bacillus pumilus DW2J2]MBR0618823.1 tetratricopeptide repeat protein [Bacillus pumilus]MBR0623014.1 tetratricopeptide repeat protein [Bacillus pumilus]MCY7725346.1 tetratricopeptide repeat protein [Bacillus pumilus]